VTASESTMALYLQVKEFILQQMSDGVLKTGERLPSEQALVKQLGFSRMTINRALRELTQEGKIVRRAGAGSFMAPQKPQSTLLQIASLTSEIRERNHVYQCDLLSVKRVSASLEVAAALDLHTGDSVFHTLCLHRENGTPVQLEERYVNPELAPGFEHQDFSIEPPAEYLLRTVNFDQIEHVVDAVLPTPEQAVLLDMASSLPCLLLTRRTWNRGRPVTLVRCLHPASRYRLGSRYTLEGQKLRIL